ncbi:hypothetical protein [Methylocaldum sp.]|uniref:hypothetical protein n=1 Tax=Methylocaldum sp. TaxID=1969727 RepID=UPI002D3965BF|nr:hypothetical protein [Methylocaldum sp.]HYE37531.1 hypothetical protein [Methylocaldum sp.]
MKITKWVAVFPQLPRPMGFSKAYLTLHFPHKIFITQKILDFSAAPRPKASPRQPRQNPSSSSWPELRLSRTSAVDPNQPVVSRITNVRNSV